MALSFYSRYRLEKYCSWSLQDCPLQNNETLMYFSEENLHPVAESSGLRQSTTELGLPGEPEEEPAQDQDTRNPTHGPAEEPLLRTPGTELLIWTNQGEEEPSLMNQGRRLQHFCLKFSCLQNHSYGKINCLFLFV